MKQTLRHQQILRCSYPRRRMTFAGKCWLGYFVALMAFVLWCMHAFLGGVPL